MINCSINKLLNFFEDDTFLKFNLEMVKAKMISAGTLKIILTNIKIIKNKNQFPSLPIAIIKKAAVFKLSRV